VLQKIVQLIHSISIATEIATSINVRLL